MTTRQPLQTLSPPSTTLSTRYSVRGANGYAAMEGQDDTHDVGSVVSGLSSLENDADDFERLMIQNARDERRLNEALHGRVQAFRKARTHPRVGLTMDNLERNNARNDSVGANAHVKFQSPPSSSGSTRSDPAIHAPPGWGRKSRVNRNWMRTITHDEEPPQTPVVPDETVNDRQHAHDANIPRQSVEDSPLSHKSSRHGTPQNDRSAEWDLTFELNEASMIASTPYVPRSTVLDDIRQREMESMREPVTTARESAPPRTVNNTTNTESETREAASSQKRLRMRTNSWKSIGKSQPVTGIGKENSPVTVYKSTETVRTVEHEAHSSTENQRPIRIGHRREDSQDLLRRLARASNTPSPGRVIPRPQTAPARQPLGSSQTVTTKRPSTALEQETRPTEEGPTNEAVGKPAATASDEQAAQEEPRETQQETEAYPQPSPDVEDIDATPRSVAQSILNPKTPVVTGAWIDTPGPKTARRPVAAPETQAQSPKKASLVKAKSPEKLAPISPENPLEGVAAEIIRPSLPGSALQALVQEAKASGRRPSADFGDSTINSLEDLITTPDRAEGAMDEDTLQGLQLPTGTPRNEAERQRQEEVVHLHRMNDRLRAARTSIRDASRGMRRVEDRVDHAEEGKPGGEKVATIYRECPCASNGGQHFSLWQWSKSFFWQERVKAERQTSNSRLKMWGGFTALGIFTLVLFTWWISEEIACEIYCHPMYAQSSPYPYAVNMNAPRYPYVIPTLVYRNLIKAWWLPLYSFLCWVGTATYGSIFSDEVTRQTIVDGTRRASASRTVQSIWQATSQAAQQVAEEAEWDLRMADDQLLR